MCGALVMWASDGSACRSINLEAVDGVFPRIFHKKGLSECKIKIELH